MGRQQVECPFLSPRMETSDTNLHLPSEYLRARKPARYGLSGLLGEYPPECEGQDQRVF